MKKVLFAIFSIALLLSFGCNKQKPHKLDYAGKMEDGTYQAQGLPGEGNVGPSSAVLKHHGYKDKDKAKDEKKSEDKSEKKEK